MPTETETTESTTSTTETDSPLSPRDELRALAAQIPELEEAAREEIKRHKDFQFANALRIKAIATEEVDSFRSVRAAEWQATLAQNARRDLISGAPEREHERLAALEKELRSVSSDAQGAPRVPQIERDIERYEGFLRDNHPESREGIEYADRLAQSRDMLATILSQIAAAQEAVDAQIERMLSL